MSAGIGGINVDGAAGAAAGGGITNINISAGTTSNNLSAVTFSNSNGVSFGINASTVTASTKAITGTNGLSISTAAGGITASIVEMTNWRNYDWGGIGVAGGLVNGNRVQPFHLQNPVAFSNVAAFASFQFSTTNNTSSVGHLLSISAVVYTRNVSTLNSLCSFNNTFSTTWQSDNQLATLSSGYVALPMTGAATTLTQGEYYMAIVLSQNNTITGANTTSFNNNINFVQAWTASTNNTAPSIKLYGAATNKSLAILPGLGLHSGLAQATLATIGLSDLNATGSQVIMAPIAFELRNATWWG